MKLTCTLVAAMLCWAMAPALAQQQGLADSGLVGKFENPTIVTDSAQWPKQFHEAPELAALVKEGKLPTVDQRLPQEPMVLKPIRAIGIVWAAYLAPRLFGAGRQRKRQSSALRR